MRACWQFGEIVLVVTTRGTLRTSGLVRVVLLSIHQWAGHIWLWQQKPAWRHVVGHLVITYTVCCLTCKLHPYVLPMWWCLREWKAQGEMCVCVCKMSSVILWVPIRKPHRSPEKPYSDWHPLSDPQFPLHSHAKKYTIQFVFLRRTWKKNWYFGSVR